MEICAHGYSHYKRVRNLYGVYPIGEYGIYVVIILQTVWNLFGNHLIGEYGTYMDITFQRVWNLYGYHLIREYEIYMVITLLESIESMENCLSPTRESPSGLKME